MSFRNRIGTFFLLGAAIFLFVFVTSVFSPTGEYALLPLVVGAVLLVVGWRWRMTKSAGGGGPPRAAAAAGTPPPGPPPPPKKRGPLGALLKGPPSKMAAKAAGGPGSNAPAGGGGKPGGGKPGGGGGKPGGGHPKGKR